MENVIYHPAQQRGHTDHGWLKSNFSFSFSNYFDPNKVHFGVLRVLNDDCISGGMGFGKHPHDNMEIISIPLSGALEHQDSLGHKSVIRAGEIQVMTAGTGVAHSEFNHLKDEDSHFLQIWLFPRKRNLSPRYDQLDYTHLKKSNELYQILSPSDEDQGVWIHQDAWFYLGDFDKDVQQTYQLKKAGNGVYIFVLEGIFQVGHQVLSRRDGLGVSGVEEIVLTSLSSDAKVLLMDIPMNLPE